MENLINNDLNLSSSDESDNDNDHESNSESIITNFDNNESSDGVLII